MLTTHQEYLSIIKHKIPTGEKSTSVFGYRPMYQVEKIFTTEETELDAHHSHTSQTRDSKAGEQIVGVMNQ